MSDEVRAQQVANWFARHFGVGPACPDCHNAILSALRAVREEERAKYEWHPIGTLAPHEFDKERWYQPGPRYLVAKGYTMIASYSYTERGKGRWIDARGYICAPTHWMPLPEPPAVTQEPQAEGAD